MIKKILDYIISRRNRFLLLAVLITAGLTLRIAAQAKYNNYMNDYTSAVAGDFFFTSNYLFAEETDFYQINSFDGYAFDVELSIRNYENALRYNRAGTDFFYTVDAKVYKDQACTQEDLNFLITVNYGDTSDSNQVAKDAAGNKYGYLRGMDTFLVANGEQRVLVSMKLRAGSVSETRYLKITAHCIPKQLLTELSGFETVNGFTYDQSKYNGVYYGTLEAGFSLNITEGNVSISDEIKPAAGDYTVRYRLRCDSATSGSTYLKVYYNAAKLSPDVSLGVPKYDGTIEGYYYIQTNVKNGGVKDLYFYKRSIETPVANEDLYFERMTNTEIDNPTLYSITVVPVSGGSVEVKDGESAITSAKANTEVTLVLTPNSGYAVDGAKVNVIYGEEEIPVTVTPLGNQKYSFVMPNGEVRIEPQFRPMIQIPEQENGTITATPENAAPGTEVTLTATPAEGYRIAGDLSVTDAQGSPVTVTTQETGIYSFVMPEIPVTVTASFAANGAGN